MGSGDRRFDALVGVGGIGSGTFFAIDGQATLGREESRSGRILDRRDYCKLHIVCHYVRALLGPTFPVLPVGLVGDDPAGRRLLEELASAGVDHRYVDALAGAATLFSLCLVYPDGTGGNLTTGDSAAARLDAVHVARAEPELRAHGARGVALALPEVPLSARKAFLELATAHGSFRVASFTSHEIGDAVAGGMAQYVDFVALNRHEADVLAPTLPEVVERMRARNPRILVSVTAGDAGSWSWDGEHLRHLPAPAVPVEGTAGAGDAHLAGFVAGLAAGLSFAASHELAGLVAAMSVTSPHSIDDRIGPRSLIGFAAAHDITLSQEVRAFLLTVPVMT